MKSNRIEIDCDLLSVTKEAKNYEHGILNRDLVFRQASKVTPHQYPNTDQVVIDEITRCKYQPDGTETTWSDSYIKIMTENGRKGLENLSYPFTIPYKLIALTLLEVIKPNGSVVKIDLIGCSSIAMNSASIKNNIYNVNSQVLHVDVAGLEIGDIIHIITKHSSLKRMFSEFWDNYQLFESSVPIKHATFEILSPLELPLHSIALKDQVENTVNYRREVRDKHVVHCWELADVPGRPNEPSMPHQHVCRQRLLVSTVSDWKDISRWYWHLCEPHLCITSQSLIHTIDNLTSSLTDPQMIAIELYNWVSKNIRYLGITINSEAPGWEPQDVNITFEKRYGVCRDKAALLVAMLRNVSIESYPVLVDTIPHKDVEVPNVHFNHVIVGICIDRQHYQLMDCSEQYSGQPYPSSLHSCGYLVAHPEGEVLRRIPETLANNNMVRIKSHGIVDVAGQLIITSQIEFAGIEDELSQKTFNHLSLKERKCQYERIIKKALPFAEIDEIVFHSNISQKNTSRTVILSYRIVDFLPHRDSPHVMPIPFLNTAFGLVNHIFRYVDLEQRCFPLQMVSACGVYEDIILQNISPSRVEISLPDCHPINDDHILWKCDYHQEKNLLRIQYKFILKKSVISPECYPQCKEKLRQIEYERRKLPILLKSRRSERSQYDVIILDHLVEYYLSDKHSWIETITIRKKILSTHGVNNHSEIKLNYNPKREELKLVKAIVYNDNQAETISNKEINIIEGENERRGERYSQGRTLVVCLPGLREGSIVEYSYERKTWKQPFFSVTHVFPEYSPVNNKKIVLRTPLNMTFKVKYSDTGIVGLKNASLEGKKPIIMEQVQYNKDLAIHEWSATQLTPIKWEEKTPPLIYFCPTVWISCGNWQTYGKKLLSCFANAATGQVEVEKKAKSIVEKVKGKRRKVEAIHNYVVENVRLVEGGGDDLPFERITPADITLNQKFGNKADRAVLLHSMLKAVGYEAEFDLINSPPMSREIECIEEDYPCLKTFDNILVRLRCGSDMFYLNNENQYETLARNMSCGHSLLRLDSGTIERIKTISKQRDVCETHYRLNLNNKGDVNLRIEEKICGAGYADRKKEYFNNKAQIKKQFIEMFSADNHLIEVTEEGASANYDSYPAFESYSFQIKKLAVRYDPYLHLQLPAILGNVFGINDGQRENMYQCNEYQHRRTQFTIEPPKGYVLESPIPRENTWQLPAGGGTIYMSINARNRQDKNMQILEVKTDVRINPFILSTDEYIELYNICKQIKNVWHWKALFINTLESDCFTKLPVKSF